MNVSSRLINSTLLKKSCFKRLTTFSTKSAVAERTQEPAQREQQESKSTHHIPRNLSGDARKSSIPATYRFVYPEFLPDPKIEWRNAVREKLERIDMLNRRKKIEIPEFYVGSILAVTSSDPHAAGKVSRFVGICIHRDRCGLRARFILRNVIDNQGLEILYEMYDPTIQKIEVLRLQKRLDDHLYYLRDALPEYSTFDPNMEAELLDEGAEVPIDRTKVVLRPRPWLERWERQDLKGVANIDEYLNDKRRRTALEHQKPWEKYDLMLQYRSTIPEEEQRAIFSEVQNDLQQLDVQRKRNKHKRSFVQPKNLG